MQLVALLTQNNQYREPIVTCYIGKDDIVGPKELEQLKPYVFIVLNRLNLPEITSLKERLTIIKRSETQAAFKITGKAVSPKILSSIVKICKTNIAEKCFVPHYMGSYVPPIKLPVMDFELENDEIVVKYVTLNEGNNFEAAMKHISSFFTSKY